ncbi:autotransporter outer membrane beta-barrel domain-containing protein [Yersinia sp. 1252 StPb PI]
MSALALDNINDGETVTVPGDVGSPATALNLLINGTLNIGISGGATGEVSNFSGFIAQATGSEGRVVVTGNGSRWDNSSFLYVGHTGNGSLLIREGGLVTSSSTSNIGLNASATGTVEVNGAGSIWNTLNGLVIGGGGTGTLIVADSGTVNANNTTLGMNTGSSGTFIIGGSALTAPGTLVGQQITVGQGSGSIILNHNATDYVLDSSLNGGANNAVGSGTGLVGNILIDSLNGRTLFNSDHGDFTGTLQVSDNGIISVNGDMSGGTASILAGGMLEGHGRVGNTVNGGILSPGNSIGTFTVNGNYTGNNGELHIETVLGDDSSATDKLIITGNASGNTSVRVTNLGGLGGQTINGISIIDVGGLAPDGSFLLAGDYITPEGQQAVIGGAYAYTLQASGDATVAGRNWYLSSELTPTGTEGETRYQPGAPLYEQYPQVLAALNTLPTLQQRVGNRYWSQEALSKQMPNSLDDNQWAWGRIEGSRQVTDPARSTSSSSRDIDIWKLQTGIDVPLHQGNDGALLTGGVNFSYGKAKADISSYFGYGSIDSSGYGVGATLTWYGNNGVYVDGQLQTMWFDSDLNSSTEGHSVANGNNGRGYASSVETGKRYSLGNGLSLTPQMQLTYSRVDFDPFSDPYGSNVSLEDADSLRGRIGVALDKEVSWRAKDGTISRSHLYSNLDLYNEFLDGSKVRVSGANSGVDFSTRDERQSVGIGAGATHEWQNGRYALYGNVSLLTATRHVGDNYAVGGTVGVRVSW